MIVEITPLSPYSIDKNYDRNMRNMNKSRNIPKPLPIIFSSIGTNFYLIQIQSEIKLSYAFHPLKRSTSHSSFQTLLVIPPFLYFQMKSVLFSPIIITIPFIYLQLFFYYHVKYIAFSLVNVKLDK